jgi:secreted trypsin-like serine protease
MKRISLYAATALMMVPGSTSSQVPPTVIEPLVTGRDLTVRDLREIVRELERLSPTARAHYIQALRMDPRIVGGQLVSLADHPWQVALVRGYMTSRSQFCGGSLVAPGVVLTAAHCVDNAIVQNNPARLDIVAGTPVFEEGGERIKARAIFVHPQWDPTSSDYDAAIVVLTGPSTMAAPIRVDPQPVQPATEAWVTGWGAIREGGVGSPDLLGARVPVVDTTTCNQQESYNNAITPQMLCAGQREGGVDSCQGDSGGPLSAGAGPSARLIGIVSWGEGCARRLKYGVYTRVSSVAPWIQSFLSN